MNHSNERVRCKPTPCDEAQKELAARLESIPKIVHSQNARFGRPLDHDDIADLVQDTVIIILRKLGDLDQTEPRPGWTARVCCLEFLNAVRRKRRRSMPLEDVEGKLRDHGDASLAAPRSERRIQQDSIREALTRLGGIEAETVAKKHFDGLTFDAIAETLEVPANTVKTRYYRGLTKLQEILRRQ